MNIRDRFKYHLLFPFLNKRTQRTLQAQYIQWQWEGYSRLVQCQMLFLCVLFFLTGIILDRYRCRVKAYAQYVFGISPELYKHYTRRYLQPWDPMHLHVRLFIRFCPTLIPRSERQGVLNQYRICQKNASQSPSSALDAILDHVESRDVDPNWIIHVRNIVEFTIWCRGRIEQPFQLRAYGQWALKDFPDPRCKDPTRYALAASIMEQLVDVFNWRTDLGIRRDYVETGLEIRVGRRWDTDYPPAMKECAPEWTKHVPPAPKPLVIQSVCAKSGMSFAEILIRHREIETPNAYFLKRNLIVDKNFLQFV